MCDCHHTCHYSAESVPPRTRCWMMYHLSTEKSPAPPSHHLPHLGAVEQGCTGVVTYKNSCPPPHPLYPSGVLSRHLSSPLCQISLEEVLLAGLVAAQQAAGGSGQRAPPVLSLPPPWAICNSSSATLNLFWPTCFAWWHRCHPITCHCLLYH